MPVLDVLCVCTHNRTRSVLMGGLLHRQHLLRGLGLAVRTAGFEQPGLPPTAETVRRLDRFGIDASGHRSRRLDDDDIDRAGLVLTAERRHVVEIAGRRPAAFTRTFTLPEAVDRGTAHGGRDGEELATWISALDEGRPRASAYLDATVGEIEDPTGRALEDWDRTVAEVERLVDALCGLLW
jgi:protein-tyrosine phosphatase